MRAFPALVCALAAVPFVVVAACSAPDPGGPLPRAYTVGGATGGPAQSPTSNTPAPEPGDDPGDMPTLPAPTGTTTATTTPTTTPTAYDAGTTPGYDAGTPHYDAGSPAQPDSGANVTGAPGSCTNPLCATDPSSDYCGCTATDSNGNQVQLGCQPGGECGCFVNQNLVDSTVESENGLCGETPADQQQFFIQTCACN
jgi:hypothetical protein